MLTLDTIKTDIISVTTLIEEFMEIKNTELFEKYQSIIKKVIPKDNDIKSIIQTYSLLEDYKFIITDIINKSEFIEMLKNQSSETYLDTYKKKSNIIMKEINKFKEKFEESINVSEDEILKNFDTILKYPSLTVTIFKNNHRLFNKHRDKILRSVLVKNISKKEKFNHALLIVGIDYDLKPGNPENLPDDKNIIIFHNNMNNAISYTEYDLPKLTNEELGSIKKDVGINSNIINLLNTIKLTDKKNKSKNKKITHPEINERSTYKIYEQIADELYRPLTHSKYKNNIPGYFIKNILEGTKHINELYSNLITEVIYSNEFNTVDIQSSDETTRVILKNYRDKKSDDILKSLTSGLVEDDEIRLMNILNVNSIEKDLFRKELVSIPKYLISNIVR